MNKKIIIGLAIGIGVLAILAVLSSGSPKSPETAANNQSNTSLNQSFQQSFSVAEKIEVVHFHATQQCWSCITVGEYALKTIKEQFPEEYASGTIAFKDINGELPENKDIVMKYQAAGSSLFVNAITAGKDNIEEDTAVWRLVSNEKQFISYFENKLNKLLGK